MVQGKRKEISEAAQKAGRAWGIGIVSGLCIVVAVNFYVVWLFSQNKPSLIANDYYQQGLDYQQTIDQVARTNQAGYSLNISPIGQLLLSLHGAPVTSLPNGRIDLQNTADTRQDFSLKIDNSQMALPVLSSGKWAIKYWFVQDGESMLIKTSAFVARPTGGQ